MIEKTYIAWIGTDGDRTIEFMIYTGIALLLLIAASVLYFIWWLFSKYVIRKKFSRIKSIIAVTTIVIVGYFSAYILPGIIREANWQLLQATCAEKVGYQSPDDNNNPEISTAESQLLYRQCLEVD